MSVSFRLCTLHHFYTPFLFPGLFLARMSATPNFKCYSFLRKLTFVETIELNRMNTTKFKRNSLYCFKYITLVGFIGEISMDLFLIYLMVTHLIMSDTYSVHWVIFWWLMNMLTAHYCSGVLLSALFFVYIISLYLSLRFKQIFESLKAIKLGKITISIVKGSVMRLSLAVKILGVPRGKFRNA